MPRTGKKARLVVAAVLAATASPEPRPLKANKGGNSGQHQRQLKSMTPAMTVLLDILYILFAAQITTLTYVGQGFNVKIVVLRSSRYRETIE